MSSLPLPPALHERVVCSVQAATHYGIPPHIMLAVTSLEGGKPGQAVSNKNGSIDYGPMQINTSWLTTLQQYGIKSSDVQNGCYPYELAAWRIHRHITKDNGTLWEKVANYHSYTPRYNATYRSALESQASYWNAWLSKHENVAKESVQKESSHLPYADIVSIRKEAYTPRTIFVHFQRK